MESGVAQASVPFVPRGAGELQGPLRDYARWVITLVLATTAVYVMFAAYHVMLLEEYAGRSLDEFVEAGLGTGGFLQLALYVTGGILWLKWQRSVNLRLRAAGRALRFTPGWTIGWYFVPYANLVMPLKVMQELWRASSNETDWKQAAASPLIGAWWPLFLLGSLTSTTGAWVSLAAGSVAYYLGSIFGMLLVAAAGVLAIMFIRQLEARMGLLGGQESGAPIQAPKATGAPASVAPPAPPTPLAFESTPVPSRVEAELIPAPAILVTPVPEPSTPEGPRTAAEERELTQTPLSIGDKRLTPRQAKSWLKMLADPRTRSCPNCRNISKPMSKSAAVGSAIGVLAAVPVAAFVAWLMGGPEAVHDNSMFLSVGAFVTIGIAWQTVKAGWNNECQRCQKATLEPLSDADRQSLVALVHEHALPGPDGRRGGTR